MKKSKILNAPITTMVSIDALMAHPLNYRAHPPAQLDDLRASLRKNGWRKPVVVRKQTNQIIAGHGIVLAAKAEGETEIPVWYWECTDADARRYLVADNEGARGAEDNEEVLARLLDDIRKADGNILGTGWGNDELNELLKGLEEDRDPSKGIDEPPPPDKEADSVLGQVYELGEHRLVVGDSQDPEVWTQLMGDEKADAMWTDPPYGVAYVGGTGMTIQNDDLDIDMLEKFLAGALGLAFKYTDPGGAWYIAAPSGPPSVAFSKVLTELGTWRQSLSWVKSSLVMGRSDYHYKHELIYYGWHPGGSHHWYTDRKQTTVLEFDKPAKNPDHPTMKPVPLIVYCLENSTEFGNIVIDCFGGSGSTLIACAVTHRKARLIELDPVYADVIRRRWTRWARSLDMEPGSGSLDG